LALDPSTNLDIDHLIKSIGIYHATNYTVSTLRLIEEKKGMPAIGDVIYAGMNACLLGLAQVFL